MVVAQASHETVAAIQSFPKLVRENTVKKPPSASESLAKLKKVLTVSPRPNFNQKQLKQFFDKRAEVVEFLIDEIFISHLSQEFPLISDDLFKMKRYLLIRSGNVLSDTTKPVELYAPVDPNIVAKKKQKPKKIQGTVVNIPLFVYTPLPTKGPVELASYKKTSRHSYYRRTEKTKLSTELPGEFGDKLQEKFTEAVAKTYRILATCYEKLQSISYQEQSALGFEVGAIWIPTIESINVKSEIKTERINLDPAMILRVRGKSFLITMWEVEDEKPIEHYIREFTTGSLKGKV